ncbi:MAG: carbamoyl transferase, partial [Candidatus Hydrogenedentota bacterium]
MERGVKIKPERENIWILGINSVYHEPSACLVRNGEIVAAVEEERFNRIRHGKRADLLNPHWLPEKSIEFCLEQAGIKASDLDYIGYSFVPENRLAFNVGVDKLTMPGCAGTCEGEQQFYELLRTVPDRLSDLLGQDISYKFQWIEHHLCHAASAYFVSPFDEAAILSTDGIGEATSTWLGVGKGSRIEPIKEIMYPNSLGFVWTKLSRFLGFGEKGQWKVMGLAAFGNPDRYYEQFREFVDYDADGNFTVDNDRLQYRFDSFAALEQLFGKHRDADQFIEGRHQDIAAALQKVTNEAMLCFAQYLYSKTNLPNLCQAGGVALNCVTNRFIFEEGPFENAFVQPAANDAGTALGACYYIWNNLLSKPKNRAMGDVFLGPEFSEEAIISELEDNGISVQKVENIERRIADLIASGEVVAWFQGRMEFGPRALGNRSILADPRRTDMVHHINDKIKHREYFRPFA